MPLEHAIAAAVDVALAPRDRLFDRFGSCGLFAFRRAAEHGSAAQNAHTGDGSREGALHEIASRNGMSFDFFHHDSPSHQGSFLETM